MWTHITMLDRTGKSLTPSPDAVRGPSRWRIEWRIAWRDLRAGLRGFGIFLGCLVIGVAAIAAVGSVATGLQSGLARQGRVILGGDAAFTLQHREAGPEEIRALQAQGAVGSVATLRSMTRTLDARAALVELKAVDADWPTAGTWETLPQADAGLLTAKTGDLFGAVADPVLLARLGLKVGDRLMLGSAPLVLTAELVSEPDKLATGVGFGPRLIVSQAALKASDLLQPGSLVRWTYRITLPPAASDDASLARAIETVKRAVPEAGFEVRSRVNAAPQFERNLSRFTQFLALVGLTALLVGGVGVANAVAGFVDRRRETIAVLKAVGATGHRVFRIMLIEIMLLAVLGVALGLIVGAALPFLIGGLMRTVLPVPLDPGPWPDALAIAGLYGLIVALAFAIWPLGRAHDVPVSALFRDEVAPTSQTPRRRYLIMTAIAIAALLAVAIGLAWDRRIAMIAVGACAAAYVLLRGVGAGVVAVARRLPRPRSTTARMALANIHRPGSATPAVVLSLGLGVALIVALASIDASLRQQLTRSLPDRAPSFFFVDLPGSQGAAFEGFVRQAAPEGRLERVPMMRGRLVSLKGTPVEQYVASEQVSWVLDGDRGITFAETMPEGSQIIAGEWWAPGHSGANLVSFDAEIAKGLNLNVGDVIVVNVLGRNIEATISNLRRIEWRTLGINFVMMFSPNTFAGAPYQQLATLTLPKGASPQAEATLSKAVADAYPAVTIVRVKDALEAINGVVSQLAVAIRGASGVALAASVLVLAGALAAGHRARIYESVVLKALGARRSTLLTAFLMEYGALGAATAVFGTLAGLGIGYVVVSQVMRVEFAPDPLSSILAAIMAVTITICLGLIGNWRILGQKAAPYLRNL